MSLDPRDRAEGASEHGRGARQAWVWTRTFTSVCRGRQCGKPITMAQHVKSGKWQPFDGEIVALRTSMAYDGKGDYRQQMLIDLSTAHHISCPDAKAFRQPRIL